MIEKLLKKEDQDITTHKFVEYFQTDTDEVIKTLSNKEIKEIQKDSFNNGYKKAKQEIDQEQQHKHELNSQLLTQLIANTNQITKVIQETNDTNMNSLIKIATVLAAKFLDQKSLKDSQQHFETLIKDSLANLQNESKITISINSQMLSFTKNIINTITEQMNLSYKIDIKADDNIHPINCKIEWQNGIIDNNYENFLYKISKKIR